MWFKRQSLLSKIYLEDTPTRNIIFSYLLFFWGGGEKIAKLVIDIRLETLFEHLFHLADMSP